MFSSCRVWRYSLWRRWGGTVNRPLVAFVGLNPSTADETQDDPTVRRCIQFAKDWGFAGMFMLNAYAFRATDPRVMQAAPDPEGPANNSTLAYWGEHVDLIVAAWGNHCTDERQAEICKVIGRPIHCLGTNKTGKPKHPLYLSSNTTTELFWEPRA